MSEFIIFSDLHFYKNYSKSKVLDNGRTSWLDTQLKLVHNIFKYAKENNIKTVIINGDIFEEKNHLPQDLYNEIWNLFNQYSEDFRIILNTGNHDFLTLSRSSSLQPFSSIVEVVRVPVDMTMGNDFVRIVPFGMLSPTSLQLPDGIYEHCILCTHEDIQGFKYSSGQEIESDTKVEVFRGWDTVFNGHIHTPQNIKNIINIGSCMIQDWGESRDSKRFIHYKDGKITDLYLECPDFIEIPNVEEADLERITQDSYNYYRIHIYLEQLGNPIFNKFNVFPKVDKKYKREVRMQDNLSFEEKVDTYISLQKTDLDTSKLANTAFELERITGKTLQGIFSSSKFILKSLYAENFRSYKNLDLPNLNEYVLTLIQGENGWGKSTARILIEYLLTDAISDNISLDELSFNKEGNCKMEGVFVREEDEAEIVITKYRDHKEYKDRTILSINGESDAYTATDRRETQKAIFNLFGLTKEILNISNIFSSKSLSFPEAKETERKKVIYDALNLHKYTPLQVKAKEQVEVINTELSELEVDLDKKDTLISSLTEEIVDLKDSEIDFRETRTKAIESLKESLQENERLIKEKQVQLDIDKEEVDEIDKSIPYNLELELKSTKDKKGILLKDIKSQQDKLQTYKNIDYQIKVNQEFIQKEEESILNNKKLLQEEQNKFNAIVINQDIEEINNQIQTCNNSLSELKTKRNILKEEINKISSTTCPILNIPCTSLEKECLNLNQKYNGQIEELSNKITGLESKILLLQKDKKEVNVLIESKRELKSAIVRLEQDINNANNSIIEFNKEIQELQKSKDASSVSEIGGVLKELELEVEECTETIDFLENFLIIKQNLKLKKVKIEREEDSINNLIAQNNSYKETITEKETEENPYTGMIVKKEEQIKVLKDKIRDVKKQISNLSNQLSYYTFWVTGFSNQGLPNLEISSFLGLLEEKTNQYLSLITKDLSVKINDQSFTKKGEAREKISYEVFSPTKKITDFSSYSGGQRQRVLLANMLSFKELVGKFNFLILDEVLELSLDTKGKEEIIKLLVNNFKQEPVFVISHDSEIKSSFDSVIEVKFENGVSRI